MIRGLALMLVAISLICSELQDQQNLKPIALTSFGSFALPGEERLRWSSDGRYILTNEGIVPVGHAGKIAPQFVLKKDQYIFSGCDWYASSQQLVVSWLPWDKVDYNTPQDLLVTARDHFESRRMVGKEVGEVNCAPAWEPGGNRVAFYSFKGLSMIKPFH